MLHPPGAPHALTEDELPDDRTLARAPHDTVSLRDWFAARSWVRPLVLFVMAFTVYGVTAFERVLDHSPDNHFVYLATTYNSMLAASLGSSEAKARRADLEPFELSRTPHHRNDWASYYELTLAGPDAQVVRGIWMEKQGRGKFELLDGRQMILEPGSYDRAKTKRRYFVSFPPGPAFLMMPLVAIFGWSTNDVLFTLFFAALNVALVFVLLERLAIGGRSGRSRKDNYWLTAMFALGTNHYWCAVLGQVWFTALIVGITCTLLYMIWGADTRRPLLAGCALAMAFATRTPLLFTAVFFFAFVLFPGGRRLRREQLGEAFRKLAWFCAPCLAMGISLLVMNHFRFESLSEFGHTYLAAGGLQRIRDYGLFHPVFLSKNLTAMFTLLPRITSEAPYIYLSRHGMSLLLTTPALVYLLYPRARECDADRMWHRVLWGTILVCALPGVFYQNTGYEQYGFRFSLDYTPYLVALLATGRAPLTRWFKAAIVAGVVVNTFGAVTFKRMVVFYRNGFFV